MLTFPEVFSRTGAGIGPGTSKVKNREGPEKGEGVGSKNVSLLALR